MDKEMFIFYRNSLARNLCRGYSDEFKKDLENKEELFRLCLRQQSIPYFATACYQQWGLNIDFIKTRYKEFINGKYLAKDCDKVKGYTYELWCSNLKPINTNSDVLHAMQCNCEINIPITKCPTLYISNKSNIIINSEGYNSIRLYLFDESIININDLDKDSNILIYKYSKDCNVIINNNCDGKVKQFDKELRL